MVSDEIHADFVFDGKHQVFADLKPEYKDFTVICTSPGKTFNIAGLQASNILIPNEALREAFAKQITAAGYSQISAPGIEAVIAAYAQGEEWYQEMKKYVGENITFLHEWMEEYIPQIKVTRTEGTYLVWMDFRGIGNCRGKPERFCGKPGRIMARRWKNVRRVRKRIPEDQCGMPQKDAGKGSDTTGNCSEKSLR